MTGQQPTDQSFGPIVTIDWLMDHLDDPTLRLIDVRPSGENGLGHIPGAVALDLHALHLESSESAVIQRFQQRARAALSAAGVGNGDRVVFYEEICGTLAARGGWLLDNLGLGNGAILDGGLQAWDARGGPRTTTPHERPPVTGDLAIDPRPETLATAEEIATALNGERPPVQLIDVRNDIEHLTGTIPDSISLRWTSAVGADGSRRPLEDIRTLYLQAGLDPDQETITYCTAGFRAAHTYVVMKALGFSNVRNYVPSWSEWRGRGDPPIVVPGLGRR